MGKGKVALALVAAAGAVVLWKRRQQGRERVDLYYEDGSMVSLDAASAESQRILPLAADAIRVARGAA